MIIRQALMRHGRRMVLPTRRIYSRSLATAVDTIEQAVDNSMREIISIESQLDGSINESKPVITRVPVIPQKPVDEAPVEAYLEKKHQDLAVGRFGTRISKGYVPDSMLVKPPAPSEITLPLLMASQAHMGHSTSLWNPMNSRYIFGIRQGIHVISLEATASHLRRACRIVSGVAQRAGLILFVGTRKGQARVVVEASKRAKGCYLFDRWVPGSITNGLLILGPSELKAVDQFDRTIEGYEEEISEIPPLKPDLVVCLNPLENYVMLRECGQHHVPTIGIIDTDADPTWVTYPIPANDDSLRCVQLIAGTLGMAAKEGRDARLKRAVAGEIPYKPVNLSQERQKLAEA